jgi:arsenite methyltransferase
MSEQTAEITVDYGLDAPSVMWALMSVGAVFFFLGLSHVFADPGFFFVVSGPFIFASGLGGFCYSKFGKTRHRDRMLSLIPWTGKEEVLDVGTGRGLLLIGAAKRLTSGRAVGIDIWSAKDLSKNKREHTISNAAAEGVADRTQILTEDATHMPFDDESFDVVLSNLVIHNIPSKEGRAKAIREVARVLKKGGVALISDFQKTEDYAREFEALGLTVKKHGSRYWTTFFPLKIIEAAKSGSVIATKRP